MVNTVPVSIVMTTRDKREYLRLTLESLATQTYKDFELILCDDGTIGGVDDIVSPFKDRIEVTTVIQENRGRAAARNASLERAGGRLVVFLDDDRLAAPDFLSAHVAAANLTKHGNIGWKRRALTWWRPGTLPITEDDLLWLADRVGSVALLQEPVWFLDPGAISEDAWKSLSSVDRGDEPDNYHAVVEEYGIGLVDFRFDWALATTANLSVPLDAVREAGGFDETFRGWGMEDTDLGYRLHRLGLDFAVATEAVNFHQIHPLMHPDPSVAQRLMRAELLRNMDHFCRRHRSLAVYLFRRRWEHVMTLADADKLLKRIEAEPDNRLRKELELLYAGR